MSTVDPLLEQRLAHEALNWLVESILVTAGPNAMTQIADQYERQNKLRFAAMQANGQPPEIIDGLMTATTARLARIRGLVAMQRAGSSESSST